MAFRHGYFTTKKAYYRIAGHSLASNPELPYALRVLADSFQHRNRINWSAVSASMPNIR